MRFSLDVSIQRISPPPPLPRDLTQTSTRKEKNKIQAAAAAKKKKIKASSLSLVKLDPFIATETCLTHHYTSSNVGGGGLGSSNILLRLVKGSSSRESRVTSGLETRSARSRNMSGSPNREPIRSLRSRFEGCGLFICRVDGVSCL